MLKRKLNKKRRKNPKLEEIPLTTSEILDIKDYLTDAIIFGVPENLVKAMQITAQGWFCTDCKKFTKYCKCEKCDDCEFNRCLCNLDINLYEIDLEDRVVQNKIRKAAWDFAKELFNEHKLKLFKFDLFRRIDKDRFPEIFKIVTNITKF